jgi:hypothetical protein
MSVTEDIKRGPGRPPRELSVKEASKALADAIAKLTPEEQQHLNTRINYASGSTLREIHSHVVVIAKAA